MTRSPLPAWLSIAALPLAAACSHSASADATMREDVQPAILAGAEAGAPLSPLRSSQGCDTPGPHGPPGRGHHRPPPEAFDACNGKTAAADCSVTLRGRNLDGSCIIPMHEADQTRLVCAPKRFFNERDGGPGSREHEHAHPPT